LTSPHPKDETANSLLVKISQMISAYEGLWPLQCCWKLFVLLLMGLQDYTIHSSRCTVTVTLQG
jgi:hypothetical protein